MDQKIKMMKRALFQAKKASAEDEVPIGAVIVKDGKVVSVGRNERDKKQIATKHAEIVAMELVCRKVRGWGLNGCEL